MVLKMKIIICRKDLFKNTSLPCAEIVDEKEGGADNTGIAHGLN